METTHHVKLAYVCHTCCRCSSAYQAGTNTNYQVCRHSWIASGPRGGKNRSLRIQEREDRVPSWEAANHLFDKKLKTPPRSVRSSIDSRSWCSWTAKKKFPWAIKVLKVSERKGGLGWGRSPSSKENEEGFWLRGGREGALLILYDVRFQKKIWVKRRESKATVSYLCGTVKPLYVTTTVDCFTSYHSLRYKDVLVQIR